MKCGTCGIDNADAAKFCKSCGKELRPVVVQAQASLAPTRYCQDCGRQIPAGASACSYCPPAVAAQPSAPQQEVWAAPAAPAGAQYEGVPPPQASPSKKKMIVVVAVVAVIVIAALAVALVLSSSGGSSSGGSSARDCLEKIETYINSEQPDKLVDCTYVHFMSESVQQETADNIADYMADTRVTISSIRTVPESEIGSIDVAEIEDWIDDLEYEIDETVSDWALLEYDETDRDRSSGEIIGTYYDQEMLCIEVGSRWYAVID